MRRFLISLAALLATSLPPLAAPGQTQVTTKVVATCGTATYTAGKMAYPTQDTTGAACNSGGGGGGSTAVTATAAAPTYVEGSSTNPISSTLKGGIRFMPITPAGVNVDLSLPASLIGADGTTILSNSNPLPVSDAGGSITVDGTVTANLGTIGGAATAAKQPALGTAGTASADVISIQGIASMTPVQTTNTALTVAQASTTSGQTGPLVQCAATTAAPTYTTAQTDPLSCDTTGALRVTGGGVAQGSTTSGQSGTLVQGAVTTGIPTYTTAQTNPLSLETNGSLRIAPYVAGIQLGAANTNTDSLAVGSGLSTQLVNSIVRLFDGTDFDRQRTIAGSFGSAVGVAAVEDAGASFSNITTATTTTVKSGAGILHKINIGLCVAAATITIYDNTAGSGTKIQTITCPATVNDVPTKVYDVSFATGLTIVTSGATDISVAYR